MRIFIDNAHMKQRVNLTIDPTVLRKAKQAAHQRHTSVSQLIEDLLISVTRSTAKAPEDIVEKWAGKLKLIPRDVSDPRREHLWKKYGLPDHADTD